MHIPTLVVDYHDPVPRSLSIVTLGMTPIAFFLFLLSRTFLFFLTDHCQPPSDSYYLFPIAT